MATFRPGTGVDLLEEYRQQLAYPPPASTALIVAVHEGALRAGARSHLTQIVAVEEERLIWTGAVDEGMLVSADKPMRDARRDLSAHLLRGERLWTVIEPGELTRLSRPLLTVYAGARPWIVLGELDVGDLVAAPLNRPSNPKWFTPVLAESALDFNGSKESQVELAHVWSFPRDTDCIGTVLGDGQEIVASAVRGYYSL